MKDDWTKGGEISDAWDRWSIFPWYMYPRYDLEWSTRVVAKIANEIPAWREGCTEIIDLMLQRMTQYAAWFDLVEQKGLDPNRAQYPYDYYDKNMPPGWAGVYNAPGYYGNGLATKVPPKEARRTSPYTQPHAPPVGRKYNPDPIYGNGGSYMMGKGYLVNMIGLYEFVCGSAKYDEPIELVYDDKIRFKYTQKQMAKVLYDQFTAPVDEGGTDLTPGIDCEVGKVFPWCVSVGGLGMKILDKIHNTNYQTGYYRWLDWAKQNLVGGAKGSDGPYEWASIYYDRDIPYNMNGPKHQIPGNWFCCAYQYWPDDQNLARRLYAGAKKKFMVKEPDGSAHINFPPELGGGEDLVGFGAAAACAWEFGDLDTHAQLMTWANTRYQPTAKEGEFYYQFGLNEPWPRGWPNDWLLMTVAGGQGSWYRLYNEPNLRKFHQPTVSGIDYPTVSVGQAYYDESLGALMVALLPGDDKKTGGKTTFKVTNLEGMERKVLQDGAPFKEWKATGEGEIEVTTTVDRHTMDSSPLSTSSARGRAGCPPDGWEVRGVKAKRPTQVLLVSAYDLGHQPFGLAEPAAMLRQGGALVKTLDLAVECLDEEVFGGADLIAFYVPMHTATRLAARMIPKVRGLNPSAHIAAYGLYAPMNEAYLRHLGVQTVLGGEFERGLTALAQRLERGVEAMPGEQSEPRISLARQDFVIPDRGGLPGLDRYAYLKLPNGDRRAAGYVEASRGCKHLCRHCPVVPVYNGRFRIIPRQIVLEDIRQQVAAGARHITFGDPDFFNGPTHALRIVMALHEEFPELTYDVTIKVQHLLTHAKLLPVLKETGCLFVTTAVESVDDKILAILEKDHTREDFFRVVRLFDEVGLSLAPTFVAFTPWITLDGYLELLHVIAELELIRSVAPVQLTIRLLIPPGSRLLELSEVRGLVGPLDEAALVYPWPNPDPEVDTLHTQVRALVQQGATKPNDQIFSEIWKLAHERAGRPAPSLPAMGARFAPAQLSEPWYCCAEPTEEQFAH